MRKGSDGYVLVYVVVVLVFLCVAALAACSAALENLRAQNAAVEQMQRRYEAGSLVEQFMGEVSAATLEDTGDADAAREAFTQWVGGVDDAISGITAEALEWNGDSLDVSVTAETADVRITAELGFAANMETWEETTTETVDGEEQESFVSYYRIDGAKSKYISYELEYLSGEGGGAT